MLADPENGDFHLMPGSPAVGSGRYGGDRGALPYVPTSVDEDGGILPIAMGILSSYPNPFNSGTKLVYILPGDGYTRLEIFNLLGQREGVVVDGWRSAGEHTIRLTADNLSSGVYFVLMKFGDMKSSYRLTVLK
ncbi:MAG: T9SS type A sorting domain-containing protein [candidate division Zixibacteria bacterium]|nr:T9SS type A sorting domain-containing protein [candidate division Zixibacteria bacterium]